MFWSNVLQKHLQTTKERVYGKVSGEEVVDGGEAPAAAKALVEIKQQTRLFCTVHVRETETEDLNTLLSTLGDDEGYVGADAAPKQAVEDARKRAIEANNDDDKVFWLNFLEELFGVNAVDRKTNRKAIRRVHLQAKDAIAVEQLAVPAAVDTLKCKQTVSKWRKFQPRGLKSAHARKKTLARLEQNQAKNKTQIQQLKTTFQDVGCDKYNLLGIQPLYTKTFGAQDPIIPLLQGMDGAENTQSSDDTKQGTVSVYCLETKEDAGGGLKVVFRGVAMEKLLSELTNLFKRGGMQPDQASRMVVKCHYQQVGFKADPSPKQMGEFDRGVVNLFEQATLPVRGYATAVGISKGISTMPVDVSYGALYQSLTLVNPPSEIAGPIAGPITEKRSIVAYQKDLQTTIASDLINLFRRASYVDPKKTLMAVQIGQTSQRQMYVDVWRCTSPLKKKPTKKDYVRASVVFRRTRPSDPLTFRVQHALSVEEATVLASGVYQMLIGHWAKKIKYSMYGVAGAIRDERKTADNTPQQLTVEEMQERQVQQNADDASFQEGFEALNITGDDVLGGEEWPELVFGAEGRRTPDGQQIAQDVADLGLDGEWLAEMADLLAGKETSQATPPVGAATAAYDPTAKEKAAAKAEAAKTEAAMAAEAKAAEAEAQGTPAVGETPPVTVADIYNQWDQGEEDRWDEQKLQGELEKELQLDT